MKRIAIIGSLLFVVVAGGGWGVYRWHFSPPKAQFRLTSIKRGDLVQTISATGTVEPREVVDVGAQVAGLINSFGKDVAGNPVDYRSVVKAGMVLAKIDDSLYRSDFQTAKAQLAQATATVDVSKANLLQAQANLVKASQDWDRAQKLGKGEALAETDYDTYQAAFGTAKANVALDEAQIVSNQAAVQAAQAALNKAQQNLDYCTITTPIDGVVVDRRVNIGETVVSSLSAPSLFLIAQDLTQVQVWISVNEADIGSIHPGQEVTFTCDAYPDRTFTGTVGKVRYNATMTNNVVTYTVEVETDNHDSALLPYLTANAKFIVASRTDVLNVPNAALRWMPPRELVDPGSLEAFDAIVNRRSGGGATTQRAPGAAQHSHRNATTHPTAGSGPRLGHGVVWIESGQFLVPVQVRTGLSDGTSTEIQSDQLQEGQMIVLGQRLEQASASAGGASPFMPQMRSSNRPQPGSGGSGGGGGGAAPAR